MGNPTTYRNNTLLWSHGRQLDSYNNYSYKYNADGIRTSKIVNGVTTKYYLDGNKVLAQDNGNLLLFHYGAEGVTGFTYQNVGEYFYKKNIFGDIIGIIDNNGQEIAKYSYDAWGNHKTYVLNNGSFVDISDNLSYTTSGSNNKAIVEINPFRYRGYYYDSETKLYYLNSRYYDPETGRFINADDVSVLSATKDIINGLNLYIYCLNNPVSCVDESGNLPNWLKWLIGAIVIVVAVVATVVSAGIGFLAGGISSSIKGGNFWDGAADGFMWGSISGAIGGGFSTMFSNVGILYSTTGKAVGSIPQIIGQGLISVSSYVAQSYTNGETPTLMVVLLSLAGA